MKFRIFEDGQDPINKYSLYFLHENGVSEYLHSSPNIEKLRLIASRFKKEKERYIEDFEL